MLASVALLDVLQVNSLHTPLPLFFQHVHFATSYRHALSACQLVSASSNFPNKQAVTNQVHPSTAFANNQYPRFASPYPVSTTSGRSISLSCSYRGLFRIFSPSVIRLQLRLPFQVSISRDLVLPVALLPLQLHRDSLCLQRLQLKITLQSASVTGKEEVVKACKGCGPEGKRRRQTEN